MAVSSAGLAKACERALVARARGAGTRQQVRAAARGFVRRYRRDGGYLRWVLRNARQSSLALALLGLSATPATAELAPFGPGTGNPLADQSVASRSAAALADLDRDGDLDVVAGAADGTFAYWTNTGNAEAPAFALAGNPLDDAGAYSAPTLGDLDGDGNLDLVAGQQSGSFRYYRNTGTLIAPAFAAVTGSGNPLNGASPGTFPVPALGDLDADGDLDLVAGNSSGGFRYFENTGDEDTPVFVERTGSANPLGAEDIGSSSAPALGDLDGDGDLDLVSGESAGAFFVFENTGTATSPAFAARTDSDNPLASQILEASSTAALGDLDGDGDPDLVAGALDGALSAFFNRAGRFAPRTGAANPLDGEDVSFRSTATLGDLDDDGLLDLVSGDALGLFNQFTNTGSAESPAFAGSPLEFDIGSLSVPALGDLDDDGDLDLVSGEQDGVFFTFANTGTATSPAFLEETGSANPLDGVDLGDQSAPALGDLDGDGDLDLVAGKYLGTFVYYENTGSAASPAFVLSGANPLSGIALDAFYAKPSFGDVDADGDLDLIAGSYTFHFVENTGNASNPQFVHRTGASNPLLSQVAPSPIDFPAPALGDLDGDGELDLVAGQNDGTFACYRRAIPETPSVAAFTGTLNPLAGFDVGALSGPALVDLDADGDPDIVAGEDLGAFRYLENTGDATELHYVERTGTANPLHATDAFDESRPAFGNFDGDDDLDLLAGNEVGNLIYYENTGSSTEPIFIAPVVNPFGLANVGSASASPAAGDLDRDGDLDLLVGRSAGGLAYFENTGDADNPAFIARTGSANPVDGLAPANYTSPAVGDFDDDGDLDVFVGGTLGGFLYLQNGGGVTHPDFERRTGSSNPLDGMDVGDRAAPSAGDLDGDGDTDLVTGALAGGFVVHYFPEPARGALIGAGLALLSLLHRLRR